MDSRTRPVLPRIRRLRATFGRRSQVSSGGFGTSDYGTLRPSTIRSNLSFPRPFLGLGQTGSAGRSSLDVAPFDDVVGNDSGCGRSVESSTPRLVGTKFFH